MTLPRSIFGKGPTVRGPSSGGGGLHLCRLGMTVQTTYALGVSGYIPFTTAAPDSHDPDGYSAGNDLLTIPAGLGGECLFSIYLSFGYYTGTNPSFLSVVANAAPSYWSGGPGGPMISWAPAMYFGGGSIQLSAVVPFHADAGEYLGRWVFTMLGGTGTIDILPGSNIQLLRLGP